MLLKAPRADRAHQQQDTGKTTAYLSLRSSVASKIGLSGGERCFSSGARILDGARFCPSYEDAVLQQRLQNGWST